MELYKREKYLSKIRGFYHETDLIKVITGIRRCGKSSLMQTIAEELIDSGINEENIVFINLDKYGYKNIRKQEDLEKLLFERNYPKGIKYIFIDEIQNVDGFELVLNELREEGDFSIFITGSNSYLLSGELVTKLTGRYIEFELFTLTFDEYEEMKKFYGKSIDNDSVKELDNYIYEGGFPRTINLDNIQDKRKYTDEVIKEIFEKDIKRRIKIKNVESFDIVMNYIINNFGSPTNINNICIDLTSKGISITRNTITKYINALIDAKILHECKRFDIKSRKSIGAENKYYLADLSLYFSRNTDNRINYGPVLENIIYIYSRSLGYAVSVGKIGNLECDFIVRDNDMNYAYIQVALTIMNSKNTEDREYRPLEMIRDNYPKYLLTRRDLQQKRNGIKHEDLIEFIKEKRLFV